MADPHRPHRLDVPVRRDDAAVAGRRVQADRDGRGAARRRSGHRSGRDSRYFNVDAPRFALPPSEVVGDATRRATPTAPSTSSCPTSCWVGGPCRGSARWTPTGGSDPGATAHAAGAAPAGACPGWRCCCSRTTSARPAAAAAHRSCHRRSTPGSAARPASCATRSRRGRPAAPTSCRRMDELQLLTHVRQVNVDDRELAAGDSDGWFAVVMANRLPASGTSTWPAWSRSRSAPTSSPPSRPAFVDVDESIWQRVHATARSLERYDLEVRGGARAPVGDPRGPAAAFEDEDSGPPADAAPAGAGRAAARHRRPDTGVGRTGFDLVMVEPRRPARLPGQLAVRVPDDRATFRELTRGLDVAMVGVTAEAGRPVVTDTGHLAVTVHDRDGVDEVAWYRGPLVPYPLTRDTLGPYHSADQCRRVTPETGAEDISYAAAFEIGRLLAAADQRLAVELARWRRGRLRPLGAAATSSPCSTARCRRVLLDDLRAYLDLAIVPVVSSSLIRAVTAGIGPVADRYGIDVVKDAPGLDPGLVQVAWRLPSLDVSRGVLGVDSTPVGAPGAVPSSRPARRVRRPWTRCWPTTPAGGDWRPPGRALDRRAAHDGRTDRGGTPMRAAWVTATDALRERLVAAGQVAAQPTRRPSCRRTSSRSSPTCGCSSACRSSTSCPTAGCCRTSRSASSTSTGPGPTGSSTACISGGQDRHPRAGAPPGARHRRARPRSTTAEWQVRSRAARPRRRRRRPATSSPGVTITGFLLRSAAVSGWPHMEVRAFDACSRPTREQAMEARSCRCCGSSGSRPSVLIALFAGVPELVELEEPHHGVQFGVKHEGGQVVVFRRRPARARPTRRATPSGCRSGPAARTSSTSPSCASALNDAAARADADMPPQTGAAMFAIEVLDLPWRQRFQSTGGLPDTAGHGRLLVALPGRRQGGRRAGAADGRAAGAAMSPVDRPRLGSRRAPTRSRWRPHTASPSR